MALFLFRRAPALETYFTLEAPALTEGDDGNKNFPFVLTSSQAFTFDVLIDYETVEREGADAATEGVDYVATSGTATLTAGQTQVTVNVPVIGDTDLEEDELFDMRFFDFRAA